MANVVEEILTDDPLSLATIATIRAKRANWRSATSPDLKAIRYRDHTFVNDERRKESRPYGWLPSGWVVQERVISRNNRVYRNYYDPSGFLYHKKHVAEAAIKDMKTRLVVTVAENPPVASSSDDSSTPSPPPNSLARLVRVASNREGASTSALPCVCCSPPN